MPTTYKKFPVDLTKGIDSKRDPKVVEGQLLTLENGSMDKVGVIKKRAGYSALSKKVIHSTPMQYDIIRAPFTGLQSTSALTDVKALHSSKDSLYAHSGKRFLSHAHQNGAWVDYGPCESVDVSYRAAFDTVNPANEYLGYDVAECNGFCLSAATYDGPAFGWTTYFVKYKITDTVTGAVVYPLTSVSASATNPANPKCVAVGRKLYLIYKDVTNLKVITFDTENIRNAPVTTTLGGGIPAAAIGRISAKSLESMGFLQIAIGYETGAGFDSVLATISVFGTPTYITSATAVSGAAAYTSTAIAPLSRATVPAIATVITTVTAGVPTFIVEFYTYNGAALAASGGPLATGVDREYYTLTARFEDCIESPWADNAIVLVYQAFENTYVAAPDTYKSILLAVKQFTCNYGGPAITLTGASFLPSVNLISEIYHNTDSNTLMVGTMYFSPYVYDDAGSIRQSDRAFVLGQLLEIYYNAGAPARFSFTTVASFLMDIIGGRATRHLYSHSQLSKHSDDVLRMLINCAGPSSVEIQFDGDARDHIKEVSFALRKAPLAFSEWNGALVMASGGMLWEFDGVRMQEHGILVYPEIPCRPYSVGVMYGYTSPGGQFGDAAADKTYNVCVTWSYRDAYGNKYTSAPSEPAAVTVPAGTTTAQLFVRTFAPPFFARDRAITLTLYATEHNGSIFYAVGDLDVLYVTVSTLGFVLGAYMVQSEAAISPANMLDNNQLYTTGGVYPNTPLSTATGIEFRSSRAYIPSKDWYLYYSKDIALGESLLPADGFSILLPEGRSQPSTVAEMSSSTVVFCASGIYFFSGEGPSAIGTQNDLSPYRKIHTDVSWVPNTPVLTVDAGILFVSNKGICLLNTGFSVAFLGALIGNIDVTKCVSILSNTADNAWIFVLEDRVLIYDTLLQQWSTHIFTKQLSASTIHESGLVLGFIDGTIFSKDEERFIDDTEPYSMKLGTSWMKPDGATGWWRLRNLALLIERKTDCKVKVKLYYDYEDKVVQEFTYDTKAKMKPDETTVTVRFYPSRHKCTAFRLEIYDEDAVGTGEGFVLVGLEIEAGQIGGLSRTNTRKMKG